MTSLRQPLGPLMLDVVGTSLTGDDRRRLLHPLVGGVILFSRNYGSPHQLCECTSAILRLRRPELLIAVDHEGGRVQRVQEGFSRIPPMRRLGAAWDRDRAAALTAAREIAYVLASELLACGVDFSFTPVLDVDFGASGVIGDRAFHSDPAAIAQLAAALIAGLREAGMASVGKHFPGHGHVRADSHLALPVDERNLEYLATRQHARCVTDAYPQRVLDATLDFIAPQVDTASGTVELRLRVSAPPAWLATRATAAG